MGLKIALLQIQEIMAEAGLDAYIDTVANVRGKLASRNPKAPKLLSGSHYDTVKDAGSFDGITGVLVPIAALKTLLIQAAFSVLHPCLTNLPPFIQSTSVTRVYDILLSYDMNASACSDQACSIESKPQEDRKYLKVSDYRLLWRVARLVRLSFSQSSMCH